MSNCGWSLKHGLDILHALAEDCHYNRYLYNLAIEDFFEPRQKVFAQPRFLKILSTIRRLANLSVNYNYLSDDVLMLLTCTTSQTLELINIKVFHTDPNQHKLNPILWRRLKRAAPKLAVSVYFEAVGDNRVIKRILLPAIPVVAIQIWTSTRRHDEDWQLCQALRHIADSYADTLGT